MAGKAREKPSSCSQLDPPLSKAHAQLVVWVVKSCLQDLGAARRAVPKSFSFLSSPGWYPCLPLALRVVGLSSPGKHGPSWWLLCSQLLRNPFGILQLGCHCQLLDAAEAVALAGGGALSMACSKLLKPLQRSLLDLLWHP